MGIQDLLERAGLGGGGPDVVVAGSKSALGDRTVDALGDQGVDVAAADPETLRDRLSAGPAALVVCHDPPSFDGLVVVRQVRDDHPELPIVAVTDGADGTAAFDAGATEVATLPEGADGGLLAARVERAIAGEHDVAPTPADAGTEAGLSATHAETVEALNDATRDLVEAGTKDEVAQVAAAAAGEVLDFAGTSVRIYNEETHELDPIIGHTVEDIESRPSYAIEDSPHGRAWKRGETVTDDIGDDDPYDREVFSQTMYVPIGEYGTLSVGIENGEFSDLDVTFAEILAKNARTAFEQAEQDRQLAATVRRVSEFADRVASASTEVTAATEQVRSASDEVTEAVDEISDGAASQSEDLQQVLDEMDNLLATVEETAATADEVAAQSAETADLARKGSERADAGMSEMERIETRTDEMLTDMRELDEEMQRIGEIVELIEDIAEQTNILALNASIEAARAGEAGEGFAVVADEVKDLAEETRDSTEEITAIIEEITDRTDRTVDDMADLREGVSEAGETVADALGALERIGEQVEATNESVQQISTVIEDQAESVQTTVATTERVASISEEVSGQTDSVAGLVREQASALEQVTANAQELETMAADLQQLTRQFEVEEVPEDDTAGGADGDREVPAVAGDET